MDIKETISYLRSPKAIRQQSQVLYDKGLDGHLLHFQVYPDRIEATADRILSALKTSYPEGDIPHHSWWRHLDARRMALLQEKLADLPLEETGRIRCELAVISVLLDGPAGPRWSWQDTVTQKPLSESEGLAAAAFDMYMDGGFSSDPDAPWRVDSAQLKTLGKKQLAAYLQVSADNPLTGFDGRVALLQKLGQAIMAHPKVFDQYDPRLGLLFDHLDAHAGNGKLPARRIITTLLDNFGLLWPGRTTLGGANMGDVWPHPLLDATGLGHGLVPFHKLSQWMTYSLIEPLEETGLEVQHVEELTALAGSQSGSFLLDEGVIALRNPAEASTLQPLGGALVIEWRALTIAIFDLIADHVRKSLKLTAQDLPLARLMQVGTISKPSVRGLDIVFEPF